MRFLLVLDPQAGRRPRGAGGGARGGGGLGEQEAVVALNRPDSSALWARVGAVVGLSAGMTVMCEEQRGALLLLLQ